MKVYSFDYATSEIRELDCESPIFAYGTKTTCGEKLERNRHFETRQEAVDQLLKETEANLSIVTRERRLKRRDLEEVEKEVADAAERLLKVKELIRDETSKKAFAS